MACMVAIGPSRAAEPDGPAALIGPAEALRIAIVNRVTDKGAKAGSEYKALADYYSAPDAHVLWVDENGLNLRAKSVMEEIGKADDYGLRASDYALPRIEGFNPKSPNATGALADAEIKLDVAVLRYARDARGGRFDWARLDPDLDPTLALPDPLQVMESIAIRSEPAAYLRSFQPDQPQFEALRKALIAARGGHVDDGVVRIPDGPVLKLGVEHEQVALLRKRLEVPASRRSQETVFDAEVRAGGEALPGRARLSAGRPGRTRHAAACSMASSQRPSSPSRTRLILLNMERWRWLPNDLGPFYVTVNIPEFTLRVMEEGKAAFTTRVVVGKPDKQTPIFSNEMQEVVFNPYWNVPNSIKMEELAPSIGEAAIGSSAAERRLGYVGVRAQRPARRHRRPGGRPLHARLEPHRYPQPQRLSAARARATCSAPSNSCSPTSTTSTCTTRRRRICSPRPCAPRAMAACGCRIRISLP